MEPTASPQAPTATGAPDRTAGVRSLQEEGRRDRPEPRGETPAWLQGNLVRVPPAMLDVGGRPLTHWFDGLAMLNAFTFSGGAVSYGSRFLETKAYKQARAGSFEPIGFGAEPCRTAF